MINLRTVCRWLALSLMHLLVTLFLVGLSFIIGMSHFDHGVESQGSAALLYRTLGIVTGILMNPVTPFLDAFPVAYRTSSAQWALMILNSGFWGLGLLWLWRTSRSVFSDKMKNYFISLI